MVSNDLLQTKFFVPSSKSNLVKRDYAARSLRIASLNIYIKGQKEN